MCSLKPAAVHAPAPSRPLLLLAVSLLPACRLSLAACCSSHLRPTCACTHCHQPVVSTRSSPSVYLLVRLHHLHSAANVAVAAVARPPIITWCSLFCACSTLFEPCHAAILHVPHPRFNSSCSRALERMRVGGRAGLCCESDGRGGSMQCWDGVRGSKSCKETLKPAALLLK